LIIARPWRAALQKPEETRIRATVFIRQEENAKPSLSYSKMRQQKTLLNYFNRVFDLVARAGFEPTTFGL
jgi:hypothetical protein